MENIIQKSILEQIRQAKRSSVMVKLLLTTQVMPLCIRFVDSDKCISEEFIPFSTLVRVTGEAIATQICGDIKKLDLDAKNRV